MVLFANEPLLQKVRECGEQTVRAHLSDP